MSARTEPTAFAKGVAHMTYGYGMSVQAIAKKTGTSPYMVQRSLDNTRRKYPELCR